MIKSNNTSYIKFYDNEFFRYHEINGEDSLLKIDGNNLTGFFADYVFNENIADIDFILKRVTGDEIDLKTVLSSSQFSKTEDNFPIFKGTEAITTSISEGCYYFVIKSNTNEVFSDVFYIEETDFHISGEHMLIVYNKEESVSDSITLELEFVVSQNTDITVVWDDGNEETYTVTPAGYSFTNSFTGTGTFNVKVYGNMQYVTEANFENSYSYDPRGSYYGYVSSVDFFNVGLMANLNTLYLDTNTDTFPFTELTKLETVILTATKYNDFQSLEGLDSSRATLTTFEAYKNKLNNVFINGTYTGLQNCNKLERLVIRDTAISDIFFRTVDRLYFTELETMNLQGCTFVALPQIGLSVIATANFGSISSSFINLDIYNISYNRLTTIVDINNYGSFLEYFFENGTQYNFRNNNLNLASVNAVIDHVCDFNRYIIDPSNLTPVTINISGGTNTGVNATPAMPIRFTEIGSAGTGYAVGDYIEGGNLDIVYRVETVGTGGEVTSISLFQTGSGYDGLVVDTYSSTGTGVQINAWGSVYQIESRSGNVYKN